MFSILDIFGPKKAAVLLLLLLFWYLNRFQSISISIVLVFFIEMVYKPTCDIISTLYLHYKCV